jgi:hypothetical protein
MANPHLGDERPPARIEIDHTLLTRLRAEAARRDMPGRDRRRQADGGHPGLIVDEARAICPPHVAKRRLSDEEGTAARRDREACRPFDGEIVRSTGQRVQVRCEC